MARAEIARRRQFSWLSEVANQVFLQAAANRHGFSRDRVDQVENNLLSAPQNWGRLNDTLNGTLDRLGLSCFSETPRDMLMWSHYGHGHTGVAIEYEAINSKAMMSVLPVIYGNDFPAMLLNAERSDRQLFRSVLYKARCWSYELEWRVVVPGAAGRHEPLSSEHVSAIYLGCKVEEVTLGLIRELLVARKEMGLPEVKVFRMYMQKDAFALVALPHLL